MEGRHRRLRHWRWGEGDPVELVRDLLEGHGASPAERPWLRRQSASP